MRMILLHLLLLFVASGLSKPKDEPVRIDLPVYETSTEPFVVPLVTENNPELKENKKISIIDSLFTSKQELKPGIIRKNLEPSSPPIGSVNNGGGLFSAPVTNLEGALLETEGRGSKILTVNDNVQGFFAGLIQTKPLVDTIEEKEKYGNNGDKFFIMGRAIVNSAENISNFVNSIIEIPSKILGTITQVASEKLNNFGGRLVGL